VYLIQEDAMAALRFVFAPIVVALFLASPGDAASLKGVTAPDSLQVDGHDLRLQGLGLRKKFVFSVYVGALYLTTGTTDAAAAIAADEPKRIEMHFLRDVGGENLEEAFREGFFNNSQEKLDRLGSRIDDLVRLFAGGVKKGEVVALTYLPEKGVAVAFDGAAKGMIEGQDFMEALWAVWLGPVPADHDLKKGMMGEK
jgi:hypothetical protein